MNRPHTRPQQVQRHCKPFRHQPRQQAASRNSLFNCRSGIRSTQHSLNQRRRRRNNLWARRKQNQARGVNPPPQVLNRQQGFALLMPLFQPCFGQLRRRRNCCCRWFVGSLVTQNLLPSCWTQCEATAIPRTGDGEYLTVLGRSSGRWIIFQRSKYKMSSKNRYL